MGPIGLPEMVGIFIIALLLFGPKKLPELGRTLGKALSEFRRAKNELKNTFETHLQELERETRVDLNTPKLESPAAPLYTPPANYNSPATYSYPYDEMSPYGATSSPHVEPGAVETASAPPAPPPVLQAASGNVARSSGSTAVMNDSAPGGTEAPAPNENHPA